MSKHIKLIFHYSYQTLLPLITCDIVLEFQILFFLGWKLLKLALRNSCLIICFRSFQEHSCNYIPWSVFFTAL